MRLIPLISLILIVASCKPIYRETSTKLFWSDISAENLSVSKREETIAKINSWALQHNFESVSPETKEVKQDLIPAMHPDFYTQVYLRPLDPAEPKSKFYITIRDTSTYFRASLATFISGSEAQLPAQILKMDALNREFQHEFSRLEPFVWKSYLSKAEQGAAANP